MTGIIVPGQYLARVGAMVIKDQDIPQIEFSIVDKDTNMRAVISLDAAGELRDWLTRILQASKAL